MGKQLRHLPHYTGAALRELGESYFGVTALSAPVVLTMYPLVTCLKSKNYITGTADDKGFSRDALYHSINKLAILNDDGIIDSVKGCHEFEDLEHLRTPVTDMLLVYTFMEALGLERLEVADGNVTNVPGITADDRAFAWAKDYNCYLKRLSRQGVDAYLTDPTTCPRP